jgi:hypothetical protein
MSQKQKIPSNQSHRYKHMYIFRATHIKIHIQNPKKKEKGFRIRQA